MARVTSYLNFANCTEEAFGFYQSVFKTDYVTPIMRFGDGPPCDGQPPMDPVTAKLVMHVALPTLGGHVLMGSDVPESMGFKVTLGNNFYINLEPDSRADADRLYAALAAGGQATMPLQEMFWGAYWGTLTDRFGVQWMINCTAK